MSLRKTFTSPFWVSFGVLVCVITSFSFAFRFAKQEMNLYRRTRAAYLELRELASGVGDQRQLLSTTFGNAAPSLENIVGTDLLSNIQVEPNEPVTLAGGELQLVTVRLRFERVRWDQIRDLMTRLETGSPPWRIESLSIEAGVSDLSGTLDVVTLERPE